MRRKIKIRGRRSAVLPKKLTRSYSYKGKKYKDSYILTKYGTYEPEDQYGMAAQKNAMSYKELIKLGYK